MLYDRAVLSMVGDVSLFSLLIYVGCYTTTQRADSGISYWVFQDHLHHPLPLLLPLPLNNDFWVKLNYE